MKKQNAHLFLGSKNTGSTYVCRGHIPVEVWEAPGALWDSIAPSVSLISSPVLLFPKLQDAESSASVF